MNNQQLVAVRALSVVLRKWADDHYGDKFKVRIAIEGSFERGDLIIKIKQIDNVTQLLPTVAEKPETTQSNPG